MAKYDRCPNCGNIDKASIYWCNKCGKVFCSACAKPCDGRWRSMTAALTAGTSMKPASIGATNAGRCFAALALSLTAPCGG